MSALKRLGALGCVGLIAATSACSSKPTSAVPGAPNVVVRIGSANAYSTLDPAHAYDNGAWTFYYNVYQRLLSYRPGANVPREDAAKSCGYTDSGDLTYKCVLRPGMTFWNGDPLDAAAVKYSIDRVIRINDQDGPVAILSTIKSVEAQGSDTVVFHLKDPDATMPDRLSSGVASIIDPKTLPADKEAAPDYTGVVGSGRYKIDSVDFTGSGADKVPSEVKLSLNPTYQGSDATPRNSGVDLKYFPDQTGTKKALDANQVDAVIADLNTSDVVHMQQSQQLRSGLQVASGPGGGINMMALNTTSGVFAKVAARRAVAQLIDRSAIISQAFNYTVTPAYTIVPSGITNATSTFFADYGRQPSGAAKVRGELAKAGITQPISFRFAYYSKGDPAIQREAELIKQQLETGGLFKVTLHDYQTYSKLSDAILKKPDFDAYMLTWYSDYLDIDDYVSPLAGPHNFVFNGYSVPAGLVASGLAQTKREDARRDYTQIQQDVAKDVPLVPIWESQQYAAMQPDITGVPLTMDTSGIQRWWMIGKDAGS